MVALRCKILLTFIDIFEKRVDNLDEINEKSYLFLWKSYSAHKLHYNISIEVLMQCNCLYGTTSASHGSGS